MNPAADLALDMARRACKAVLEEAFSRPEDCPVMAWRSYTLDSGLLKCRAIFDGESVVTSWDIDGRPLCRAAAESMLAARPADLKGGQT